MREETRIKPKYMLLLVAGAFIFSIIYYFIGTEFMNSPLSYYQYLVFTTILAIVIVGGYQIFFWTQRNNYFFKTRCLKIWIDDHIPFWPKWVWVYSLLYYIIIGYVAVSIKSIEEGTNLIFGGLVLLFLHSVLFLVFPCTVPASWRRYNVNSLSTRYLRFIQGVDNGRNCFPSKHCSLATYVGLILMPVLSFYSVLLILLIVISCLFIKQHQIADVFPGVILGWIVYTIIV